MNFVSEIYKVSKSFPKEEIFCLTSLLRRSTVSIPSNVFEGNGRERLREYLRFFNIAIASLFEFQTHVEIAFNLE
ncbi:four helix bundle protein [Polaribacter sp. Z014]|uniref:four helix bundle protein n=1 Tax=Polaribacter sp. Z014 TaxID=2927126 RepID=UPI0020218BB8|nr:four helix bundle protein [Polaribacter sp. Z014]MCL7764181.1 four helix bundle protein [Polaribacter sp. Z014]